MAKSIAQTVDWKKADTAPEYETAARVVDTFVAPPKGKGEHIARALEQASGSLNQLGNSLARKQAEQQRVATAQEKATAVVDAAGEATHYQEFLQNRNPSEHDTYESVFAEYTADKDTAERFNTLLSKYSPQARVAFDNNFRMNTEGKTTEAVNKGVKLQRIETTAKQFPIIFNAALEDAHELGLTGEEARQDAFRTAQAMTFGTLTQSYDFSNTDASSELANILTSQAHTRDSAGNANVEMLQRYLDEGYGDKKTRDAAFDVIRTQTRYAALEKQTKRDEVARAQQALYDSEALKVQTGEVQHTEAEIAARSDLTDANKTALITWQKKVNLQSGLEDAQSHTNYGAAKDALMEAALSGDFSFLGINNPRPSRVEIENAITERYTSSLNKEDLPKLVEEAGTLIQTINTVDGKVSRETLSQKLALFEKALGSRREGFARSLNKDLYPHEVSWEEGIRKQYIRGVQNRVNALIKNSDGGDVDADALQAIYNEVADAVLIPIKELSQLRGEERAKAIKARQTPTSSEGGLKVGAIVSGYKFLGGDPNDKDNWEAVK